MFKQKDKENEVENKQKKRPFAKTDFEAVLKSATRPLKKEQGERESAKT